MNYLPKLAVATYALLMLVPSAYGVTLEYPFNDLPSGFDFQPGVAVESGGLTITVTPNGYPAGAVSVYTTGGPGEVDWMGARSVNPSRAPDAYGQAPARFDFSLPVVAIDLAYYDQGGDDDGNVILTAYSHERGWLGSFTESYGTAFGGSSGQLEFPAGIDYLVASTTGGNPHSVGWSIRSVTAVPELTALPLGVLAFGAAALPSRRQHRA